MGLFIIAEKTESMIYDKSCTDYLNQKAFGPNSYQGSI